MQNTQAIAYIERAKQYNMAVENGEKRSQKVSSEPGGSYVTCTIGLCKSNDEYTFRQTTAPLTL